MRDLGAAWDSIRSWKTEVAIRLRPPVPLPLLKCFVIASFSRGLLTHLHEAHLWIAFGILLQVGFHGLLRPQELDALHRSHVILPSSSLFGTMSTCVLSIWQPKNRRFSGRAQFRTIRDALTVQWLEWSCKGLPPHAKIFLALTSCAVCSENSPPSSTSHSVISVQHHCALEGLRNFF